VRLFLDIARDQIAGGVREGPSRVRRRFTDESRAARCATVDDLRRSAARVLPRVVFDFVDGGAGREVTLRRNCADFEAIELRPRVLSDVGRVDLSREILGERSATPMIGAPTGGSGLVHHSGEPALARALARAGGIYTQSVMSSYSIEDVAAASAGARWLQVYLARDRGFTRDLLARGRELDFRALVVTVDAPRIGSRERDLRNRFSVPPRITGRGFAEALVRPRWSRSFLRDPPLAGNIGPVEGGGTPAGIAEFMGALFDPSVTWSDIGWIREEWSGPLLVKGILTPADARRAVEAGADGIVVSNHGGRQLDGAPSTIAALPRIADAVGGEAELILDGGIRRGADILAALALGASACMVGRPLLFGLATAGERGVDRALEILTEELRLAMALMGLASLGELTADAIGNPSHG
jgi:L-lactate dehydrogenase (cytochrome)